ncbi:MAG: class I SAM-dependent methyltransferase [Anaerolineales bacterium]|uniref:Class I SAM-dependent methyltransferase n=1 Tax=Candidatus Desulfolinea nitratireducens TaxID=2841698 RepID=A0A8J6TIJ4_9CHLR|nr:class I SAM-dependent methyltransferase [Candidatus Desulfolinea nitratireducens]MBL6960789.1 class I SAM-dependent methyltransferase [Anaerolineales bacterium]
MTDKKNIIQAFTNMAPRYEKIVDSELQNFWGWSYRGVVDSLFEDISVNGKDIILDIATGTGVIPDRLLKNGIDGNRIHGLDITRAMLEHAQLRLNGGNGQKPINLTCASAMEMPYANASFTIAVCGLATHHMSVEILLSETCRILRRGGKLTIADAGGMLYWKIPGIKLLLKIAAFIYFSITDDPSRAWSEADAVSNVRSKEEWSSLLSKNGFEDISIVTLISKFSWISSPLIIKAEKR